MTAQVPEEIGKLYVSGGCGQDHEMDENHSFSCEVCEAALRKLGYHRAEGWSVPNVESTG